MTHSTSKRSQNKYTALYGAVAIEKQFCEECGRMAFVFRGRFSCCDGDVKAEKPKTFKRVVGFSPRRHLPPSERKRILEAQFYQCFWCGMPLESLVFVFFKKRSRTRVTVRTEWDHIIPYCYTRDNRPENFAATCNLCNQFKNDRIFDSIESAKEVLKRIWAKKIKRIVPEEIVLFAEPNLLS